MNLIWGKIVAKFTENVVSFRIAVLEVTFPLLLISNLSAPLRNNTESYHYL
jgi:hypothetical protein